MRELRALGAVAGAAAAPGVPEPFLMPERIGPVSFVSLSERHRRPLIADCLLGRALVRSAPILARFGVRTARYSRSYTPVAQMANKRSAHQLGRAIDVHEFTLSDGSRLIVERDYPRGNRDCPAASAREPSSPGARLRAMVCALFEASVFDLVLTPNYNEQHRNHFHLEVRTDGYRSLD